MNKKQLTAGLLCLTLLSTTPSLTLFASEQEASPASIKTASGEIINYDSFESAIAAMDDGDTLIAHIDWDNDIEIDANEHWNISFNSHTYEGEISLSSSSGLTIADGTYLGYDFGIDAVSVHPDIQLLSDVIADGYTIQIFENYLSNTQIVTPTNDEEEQFRKRFTLVDHPEPVYQVGDLKCASGVKAARNAHSGDTITLLADSYDAINHVYGLDELTIDANGHTMYGTIEISSNLTLKGGTFAGRIVKYANKAISFENGVRIPNNEDYSLYFIIRALKGNQKLVDTGDGYYTISGNVTKEDYAASLNGKNYVYIDQAVEAAKSGDTIKILKDVSEMITINANQKLKLDFGTHKVTGNIDCYGECEITGGIFGGTKDAPIELCTGGPITISGGTWNYVDMYVYEGFDAANFIFKGGIVSDYVYDWFDYEDDVFDNYVASKYKAYKNTNHTYSICPVTTVASTKITSLTNASTGLTLKWNKVSGATGYYVYRKTSSGAWAKIATTTALSFADKKANTNGTAYSYKIYAYKTINKHTFISKASTAVSTYRLALPSVSVNNNKKKAITVKWTKNTKATGYQIQICTAKTFKGAKTYTVASYKTYTKLIKKLTKNKTYYIRVRDYKKASGKTFYSSWSSTKSVKIKK